MTKSGILVPCQTVTQMHANYAWQRDQLSLAEPRIVEGAAFSFAMVVRYALGLSAEGGTIGALVRDCRAGHVVIATIRHLLNAGAQAAHVVVVVEQDQPQTLEMQEQLAISAKLGANVFDYEPSSNNADFEELLKGCHNLLVGTFASDAPGSDKAVLPLIEILNELPTPGHCVEMPFGVDPETGKAQPGAMYASSTLSLGLPLSGCLLGSDHLGRHYLADSGMCLKQYRDAGLDGSALFADQPVIALVHE